MEKESFHYSKTIRDMPLEERPRERLARLGPKALKDAELIAVLFRTGTRELSAVALAEAVINTFGNLQKLSQASIEEITTKVKGIGKVKAIELKAALELGKRLVEYQRGPVQRIKKPEDVAHLLMNEYKNYETEHFKCILLNIRNDVLKVVEVSHGGLDNTIANPSDVFRDAVRIGASNVIVTHNHPSGDVEPSQADIDITKQLVDAGNILGIQLLDHIIFGDGKYLSLKERGIF
ncbi:MAG TPA: DNA repair protein RadC [Candidatus Hydrogenedens sp.]|nr:DNA repair protein RadC [Candidatus Hydrogenedens sp.]HOL20973.1 DNA repair protein RadC [Candidatus Hydrogenedens sp.]HPP58309.1 DNA repair protein RadC [Candidatus Hydrogenedens sp.]